MEELTLLRNHLGSCDSTVTAPPSPTPAIDKALAAWIDGIAQLACKKKGIAKAPPIRVVSSDKFCILQYTSLTVRPHFFDSTCIVWTGSRFFSVDMGSDVTHCMHPVLFTLLPLRVPMVLHMCCLSYTTCSNKRTLDVLCDLIFGGTPNLLWWENNIRFYATDLPLFGETFPMHVRMSLMSAFFQTTDWKRHNQVVAMYREEEEGGGGRNGVSSDVTVCCARRNTVATNKALGGTLNLLSLTATNHARNNEEFDIFFSAMLAEHPKHVSKMLCVQSHSLFGDNMEFAVSRKHISRVTCQKQRSHQAAVPGLGIPVLHTVCAEFTVALRPIAGGGRAKPQTIWLPLREPTDEQHVLHAWLSVEDHIIFCAQHTGTAGCLKTQRPSSYATTRATSWSLLHSPCAVVNTEISTLVDSHPYSVGTGGTALHSLDCKHGAVWRPKAVVEEERVFTHRNRRKPAQRPIKPRQDAPFASQHQKAPFAITRAQWKLVMAVSGFANTPSADAILSHAMLNAWTEILRGVSFFVIETEEWLLSDCPGRMCQCENEKGGASTPDFACCPMCAVVFDDNTHMPTWVFGAAVEPSNSYAQLLLIILLEIVCTLPTWVVRVIQNAPIIQDAHGCAAVFVTALANLVSVLFELGTVYGSFFPASCPLVSVSFADTNPMGSRLHWLASQMVRSREGGGIMINDRKSSVPPTFCNDGTTWNDFLVPLFDCKLSIRPKKSLQAALYSYVLIRRRMRLSISDELQDCLEEENQNLPSQLHGDVPPRSGSVVIAGRRRPAISNPGRELADGDGNFFSSVVMRPSLSSS